jgi:CheY-like chemotaxis protein
LEKRAVVDLMIVLVVEDDPFVREMAVVGLEGAGSVFSRTPPNILLRGVLNLREDFNGSAFQ